MEVGMPSNMGPDMPSDQKKWTVMVFMGAATLAGNTPLLTAAEADLAEMRFVGSGDGLEILVQVHQGEDIAPRRAHITGDTPAGIDRMDAVPDEESNPRGGHALECFIRWAIATAKHDVRNPNHHTLLVLWGHAYDFAIGRSPTRAGTVDALDFAEISQVLERLRARFGTVGRKIDILGFDACDLSTVEIAYQLQPFANYLLGSQIGIPIPGWPYDRILDRLRNPYGDMMGPAELGSYIVRRFCESYSAESRVVSLTLLDLNRADELASVTQVLALTLASAIADPDTREHIAYLFSNSQTAPGKPYVDVADLCLNLTRHCGDVFVVEAAKTLGDFLISPQPVVVGDSDDGAGRPFILEHGRNTGQTARLNGLSIYAPHVAPGRNFEAVRPLYDRDFVFAQETQWSGMVHALTR
jgi:hypothetical protein